jgi:hypothetical protein
MRKLALLIIAVAMANPTLADVVHRERIPAPGSLHCSMDTWTLVYFSRNWDKPPYHYPSGGWIVHLHVFKREGPISEWKRGLEHLGTFTTFDQAAAFLRQVHAIAHGDETDCPSP